MIKDKVNFNKQLQKTYKWVEINNSKPTPRLIQDNNKGPEEPREAPQTKKHLQHDSSHQQVQFCFIMQNITPSNINSLNNQEKGLKQPTDNEQEAGSTNHFQNITMQNLKLSTQQHSHKQLLNYSPNPPKEINKINPLNARNHSN